MSSRRERRPVRRHADLLEPSGTFESGSRLGRRQVPNTKCFVLQTADQGLTVLGVGQGADDATGSEIASFLVPQSLNDLLSGQIPNVDVAASPRTGGEGFAVA